MGTMEMKRSPAMLTVVKCKPTDPYRRYIWKRLYEGRWMIGRISDINAHSLCSLEAPPRLTSWRFARLKIPKSLYHIILIYAFIQLRFKNRILPPSNIANTTFLWIHSLVARLLSTSRHTTARRLSMPLPRCQIPQIKIWYNTVRFQAEY